MNEDEKRQEFEKLLKEKKDIEKRMLELRIQVVDNILLPVDRGSCE